jgi:hypothetical protein
MVCPSYLTYTLKPSLHISAKVYLGKRVRARGDPSNGNETRREITPGLVGNAADDLASAKQIRLRSVRTDAQFHESSTKP